MRATLSACLMLACIKVSSARGADLRLSLAVPLPLAVYGYINSGGGGGGGGLDFLGSLGLDLALPLAPASDLALELWAEGGGIAGSDGSATALIYFAAAGFGLAWRPDLGHGVALHLSLGPALLASGIVVDANMRLDTWSIGGRVSAALDIAVAEGVFVGPWVSFVATGPPLDEDAWFNRPLRGTRYFRAGVAVRFGL